MYFQMLRKQLYPSVMRLWMKQQPIHQRFDLFSFYFAFPKCAQKSSVFNKYS